MNKKIISVANGYNEYHNFVVIRDRFICLSREELNKIASLFYNSKVEFHRIEGLSKYAVVMKVHHDSITVLVDFFGLELRFTEQNLAELMNWITKKVSNKGGWKMSDLPEIKRAA